MRDERGEPAGVSVDLANALGAEMGRPIQIQNLPFDGLIPSLTTGKIDLIISSMTMTPERARVVDFSEPYLRTGLCLLVGRDSGVASIADANRRGRTIVVKKGTTGHLYAARELREAKILVLDKEAACVLEVAQGKADVFIYDQMSVFSHWKRNPKTTRAVLAPFQTEAWAIGIKKGDDTTRQAVNAFLKRYRDAAGFERLGDKWLSEQKTEFKRLGIDFFF
jgi:polar amino acid transport system substrate-binding protein